jgi:hypothetical protein
MRLETTAQADIQTGYTRNIYISPKVELLLEFHWNCFPYSLHFRPMLFIVCQFCILTSRIQLNECFPILRAAHKSQILLLLIDKKICDDRLKQSVLTTLRWLQIQT